MIRVLVEGQRDPNLFEIAAIFLNPMAIPSLALVVGLMPIGHSLSKLQTFDNVLENPHSLNQWSYTLDEG